MALVWYHTQVLDRGAGLSADPERLADCHPHLGAVGERPVGDRLPGSAGLHELTQQVVRPYIGATCASVAIDPEDHANRVILEPSGEDVGRAIAAGIRDEYDRPMVALTQTVGQLVGRDRESTRVDRPGE